MSNGIPFGDLIVLGAVALFIILRYRSILGQKTGHDFSQKPTRKTPAEESGEAEIINLHPSKEKTPIDEPADLTLANPQVVQGIAKIKSQDPDFTIASFLDGAKIAFEMVIDATNKQDKDTLRMLLSKEVYDSFEQDMKQLADNKQLRLTTLVALKSADISDVDVRRNVATITVQFLSEQIIVLKDAQGAIIEGNASEIDDIVDEWILERDLKSRNPNWTVVAT